MKLIYKLLPLLIIPMAIVFFASSSGSPGGKTGSPGDNGNNCTQCHSGTPQNASNWITTNIGSGGYVNGQTYTITASGTHPGVGKFGFELTAEDEDGNKVGTFAITNPAETKLTNGNKAVTHTSGGTTPSGNGKSWSVNYTVPQGITGDITFYAALNAANGNGGTSGDQIYLASHTVNQDVTGVDELANDFRIYPNPSHGIVNVEMPENKGVKEMYVFNNSGQLAETVSLRDQSVNSIDLTHLTRGIYFVKLQGNETGRMQKLVIN